MTNPIFQGLKLEGATPNEIAIVVNNLLRGKLNSVSTVSLDTGTSSTTVSNLDTGPNSYINFMPTTADAASELASGNMYVSSRGKQTFTITHSSSGSATRSFVYVILG